MLEVTASRRGASWWVGITILSGMLLSAPVAHGANKKKKRDECIAASEEGQLLKVKGKLRAAREQLLACSDKACPGAVRKDCEAEIAALEIATPTVVFAAKDGKGHDLVDVRVSVDGEALVEQLDGKAVAIDPGAHDLRFEADGLPTLEKKVVVREGEKARVVLVTLEAPKPPPPKKEPESEGLHTPNTTTLVVGGAGAALLATAGVVGFVALQKRSSLYDRCGKAGTCTQDEVDSVYGLYDISYVTAGLGGALLLTGAVLYFTSSPEPDAKEAPAVGVAPTLGGAVITGRF